MYNPDGTIDIIRRSIVQFKESIRCIEQHLKVRIVLILKYVLNDVDVFALCAFEIGINFSTETQ